MTGVVAVRAPDRRGLGDRFTAAVRSLVPEPRTTAPLTRPRDTELAANLAHLEEAIERGGPGAIEAILIHLATTTRTDRHGDTKRAWPDFLAGLVAAGLEAQKLAVLGQVTSR